MPFIQNKLVDQFIDHESSSFLRWKIVWALHVRMSHELFTFDMNTSSEQLYRLPFFHGWISEPHWISFVLINYVRKWTSQLWEMEEFHVWSMTGHSLVHYWGDGYNTFLENRSDVCNFEVGRFTFPSAKNLKFDMSLLLFWFTFWLMDKVTKLSTWIFHLFPKLSKRKIMWSGFSKSLNSPNWMLQQQ